MSKTNKINLIKVCLTKGDKTENFSQTYLTVRRLDRPSRKIIGLILLAAVVLNLTMTIAPSISQAGSTANMNRCADKAIYGKGKKLDHIKIEKHHFHCYPAMVSYPKDKPGVIRIAGRSRRPADKKQNLWNCELS